MNWSYDPEFRQWNYMDKASDRRMGIAYHDPHARVWHWVVYDPARGGPASNYGFTPYGKREAFRIVREYVKEFKHEAD